MSQTETILLVVLGFALAALIALFAGRLVWMTALRLGARRMQRQVPSTVVDLQTERDRLRAEFAMLSQRLGDRLETVKLRMAEHMAEVNRHRNRLEIADAELEARSNEIKALKDRVAELDQLAASRAETIAGLEAALAGRERQAVEFRERLNIPEPRLAVVPEPAEPATTATSHGLPASLAERIAHLNRLAQHVAAERSDQSGHAGDQPAASAQQIEDASAETLDIQRELERLDAKW